MTLLLEKEERRRLWQTLTATIEKYFEEVGGLPVAPPTDIGEIRARLAACDFRRTAEPVEALDFAARNLYEFQVHTPHPRYFELFNPAPAAMSVAADALGAAFNPQIAAWSHSPFAAAVGRHLIGAFGARFGFAPGNKLRRSPVA
ncbi:MAG: hypothetical protein JSS81_18565 [Acidobacteria bacterium]|nr:hypothetical protein [Acidobacteriota bacterium]